MAETTTTIAVGFEQPVIVDKLYGPSVFANLRITADAERGWIIEREWPAKEQYVEWCIIPAPIEHGLYD